MKKVLSLLIVILLLTACSSNKEQIVEKETNKDSDISMINVIINDKEYNLNLEDNKTVEELLELLPIEEEMTELNGNEKYLYLDKSLPTNSINPKHINSGDVMLFGDNCLVIFYKSFDTTYSYTKIGHIDNLEDLGNSNITVKFTK